MRISVVYSLPTRRALATPYAAADEDTKDSATEVAKELSTKGVEVELVPVSEDTIDDIGKIRADCVFNLIEWDGLDLSLAVDAFRKLEFVGIPFTGVSSVVLEKVANKIAMKQALYDAGLPTPGWQIFEKGSEAIDPTLTFPAIVKPLYEHCSIGLTYEAVVEDKKNLASVVRERIDQYKQPVFAEEFIIGREFQVTVLERADGLSVLPPAEIIFDEAGTRAFLTYASRWIEGHPEYETSSVELAKLTPELKKSLATISLKAFSTLGYRDYSRLDIRSRDNDVFILEANANPGLEDDEAYGMSISFHAAGLSFADFLWEIVNSCLRRNAKD
ncbi:hypothetical protein HY086_04380 [Candidatus Gottesmanbacteria bacterium]|nr:hypothetical protein [Candidatus Gottesmanbacteria bacterium]